jgi:hypothetical protein
MSGYLKLLGALRLVDLLAGNSRHPALLAISDMIVDAAALSVRDNDAAAADGRAPPSAHGVHVLGWPFRQSIWASRKPGANVSVALLIANGWRPDGWWREVGSDTPDLCRVATEVLAVVPSSYL